MHNKAPINTFDNNKIFPMLLSISSLYFLFGNVILIMLASILLATKISYLVISFFYNFASTNKLGIVPVKLTIISFKIGNNEFCS